MRPDEAFGTSSCEEDESGGCSDVSSENEDFQDNYSGFKPPVGVTKFVDRIPPDISPREFYEQFVRSRRPVIINGHLKDTNWKGSQWLNSYLNRKAGHAKIFVEDRKDPTKNGYLSYGTTAPKVQLLYGEFLSAVSAGGTRYYMTTQETEKDEDNCDILHHICSEPLLSLTGEFPVRPEILGNLIPHQASLWQGLAGSGKRSSSGLHHDFHDNLYVLIRGHKRFRLFPPSALPFLQVVGKPVTIYPNGLVVYEASSGTNFQKRISVRADGAPFYEVAQLKRDEAERDLAAAEERLASLKEAGVESATRDAELEAAELVVTGCEQHLEDALEQLLKYEMEADDDSDDDSFNEPAVKRLKPVGLPDHFSQITLPEDDILDLRLMFPSDVETADLGCLIAELQPGEMLYLPASWFHEVSSYDDSRAEKLDATDSSGDVAGHLALNYWMYPPDGESFDLPYADTFWSRRWDKLSSQLVSSNVLQS